MQNSCSSTSKQHLQSTSNTTKVRRFWLFPRLLLTQLSFTDPHQ
jgi:hypothetical protein